MAALRLAGITVALYVSRAEGGEAALLRRDPAHRRRVPTIARRLPTAGPAQEAVQSGLAHPRRHPAASRDAGDVLDAADFGVVVERGKRRHLMGFHRPLPAGRDAADPP